MRTMSPWSRSSADERDDDDLVLEQLEQSGRAIGRAVRALFHRDATRAAHVERFELAGDARAASASRATSMHRSTTGSPVGVAGSAGSRASSPGAVRSAPHPRGRARRRSARRRDGGPPSRPRRSRARPRRARAPAGATRAARCAAPRRRTPGPTTTEACCVRFGEELARLVEEVLERVVRGREEVGDGAALGRWQTRRTLEVIDEEAVAAVGRDAAGRGVRLHEVALALEDRHVVAHGRARDPEVARRGDRLGPDRLGASSTYSSTTARSTRARRSSRGGRAWPSSPACSRGAVVGRHAAVPVRSRRSEPSGRPEAAPGLRS